MNKWKEKIDRMLKALGYPESTIDDGIVYFGNGLSLDEEEREFKFRTLRGKQSEQKMHYILMAEVYEYNYPNEPDSVDIVEVGAFLDVLSAVSEMIRVDTNAKIDGYLEHLSEIKQESLGV